MIINQIQLIIYICLLAEASPNVLKGVARGMQKNINQTQSLLAIASNDISFLATVYVYPVTYTFIQLL